ncbi:hypothetical protein Q3G72_018298 [Acer saccharum]|nr:hypothetical protein Q3G72_018298 [Acer saccharum]
MPYRIELSEQGSISQTIRAAELALALDTVAGASVHCDFAGSSWRHLLSGSQQFHLHQLTRVPRRTNVDANFAPSNITALWLRPAQLLPAYPPEQAWLVTTGGAAHAQPQNADLWFGHIETVSPGFVSCAKSAAASMPIALNTHAFKRQKTADGGILVIGCGDAQHDMLMLQWLGHVSKQALTLFDPYTQHTHTSLPDAVTRVEIAQPKERAALYSSCRYVVSGSLTRNIDDHFVCEAIYTGALGLAGATPNPSVDAAWDSHSIEQAWQTRDAHQAQSQKHLQVMDVHAQAEAIDRLVHDPANGPAWLAPRITQYCNTDYVPSNESQLAWIDCGRNALWDDALADWISKTQYQTIYVDISRNALLLSSIFTSLLTRQLSNRAQKMPHIQGVGETDELALLVQTHLQKHTSHKLDVIHLTCSLPQVMHVRKRLQGLDTRLIQPLSDAAASSEPSVKPRFLFNCEMPKDTTRLSVNMIGAPVAAEGVFQGILRASVGRFDTNWVRSTDFWSSFGRVYYYPFAPEAIRPGEEIDTQKVCAGLKDDAFDLIMTGGPLMTGLLYARRLWANKCVPLVAMLHSLHTMRNQIETLPQLIFGNSLASDLFVSPTECGKIAYANLLEQTTEEIARKTQKRFEYKGDFCVIPYGIDTSWYQNMNKGACREMLQLPHDRCIFLSLGRFHRHEKFDLLPVLLAVHAMVHAGDNPLLILAGPNKDHDYAEEVRRAVGHLNLGAYVEVRENIASAHKPYLYGACDIFVSPSDNIQETYGLTILEAMAASLPVIASCWDGYREIVVDGATGILVPTRWTTVDRALISKISLAETICGYGHRDLHQSIAVDVEALCLAMHRLYHNKDLRTRMGEAGLRRAQADFDIRQQSQKFVQTLSERAEMAKHETWPALDARNTPYIDDVFKRFSHYTTDIVDVSTRVRLTKLAHNEQLLAAVLDAAELGDKHEVRKVFKLVEHLGSNSASIESLKIADIDAMRAMRCLKYGILQVEP